MRISRLGRSDVEVSAISFGAYAIGGWYWGERDSDEEAMEALVVAFEGGVRSVDTAPVYGFGHSERLIGEARRRLGADGERFAVMTKVGLRWDDPRGRLGFHARDEHGKKLEVWRNGRPDSVAVEIDRSLERLGVERIDVAQVHTPDPTVPVAETVGALADAVDAGKVRAIGVSNFSPDQIRESLGALSGRAPLAATQSLYNGLDRGIEAEVLPLARESEVGVIAYSPLDQGLLTGKVGPERTFPRTDGRHRRVSFLPANRARVNACLADVIEPVARAHGATVAQVVLAWTIAQPGITTALVGARSQGQARDNAAAGALELTPEELDSIGAALAAVTIDRPRVTLADRARGWWHRLRHGR